MWTRRLRFFFIVDKHSRVLLTRPRRFGKSLLVSVLNSLFRSGVQDFQGLKIEKLWQEQKPYKVVRLDFSVTCSSRLERFELNFVLHLISCFSEFGFQCDSYLLSDVLEKLSEWLEGQESGSLVLLVDEYEAPLTACLGDSKLFGLILEDLSNFFSLIGSLDSACRFVFITGIVNFRNTGMFCALKNLSDISLDPKYGSIVGFTTQELKDYFSGYIEEAVKQLGMEPEALLERLAGHYDGYGSEKTATVRVMNPWSILSFLIYPTRGFRDYWFQTGGQPLILKEFFRSGVLKDPKNFAAVKSIPLEQLGDPVKGEGLTELDLLTQTGYLTIKSVDGDSAIVAYPNEEVRITMAGMYLQLLLEKTIEQAGVTNFADRLVKDDAETLVRIFNRLLETVDYEAYSIEDVKSVLAVIQVAMISVGLSPVIKVIGKEGSALEAHAGRRTIVFALEYCQTGHDAEQLLKDAVRQLERSSYGKRSGENEVLKLALVFSKSDKRITRWSVA
ncbi:AAA family ATPase [Parasutterella excrementihominis]|uniref:AAA family ATPase n=1 Tax=Parasutterella excrementihominis TaxID=487175 RepID=UPI0026701692|nr:AAA family ATPase [Parasutterella excrementihominis]